MLDPQLKDALDAAIPRKKPTIIGWVREHLADIEAYNRQGLTYPQIAQVFSRSEDPVASRVKPGTLKSYISLIKKEQDSTRPKPSNLMSLPKPKR